MNDKIIGLYKINEDLFEKIKEYQNLTTHVYRLFVTVFVT